MGVLHFLPRFAWDVDIYSIMCTGRSRNTGDELVWTIYVKHKRFWAQAQSGFRIQCLTFAMATTILVNNLLILLHWKMNSHQYRKIV